MAILLEQESIHRSHFIGDKLVLEPVIESNQILPFLDSKILKPELFKKGILQLNQILMAHPGVNLNVIYDPIVTVTENYVDFDGFARFGHSYCKVRFPEKLFAGRIRQEGTTNVDFNPRFIRNLRQRSHTKILWLYINSEGIELAMDQESHHLKKIKMPNWWKPAYEELKNYVDIETLELNECVNDINEYNKVILSGNSFQKLIQEIEYNQKLHNRVLDSLLWNDKSVNLVYNIYSKDKLELRPSVNLITPCNKFIYQWGIWRIQNLSEIAEYVIQADVYLAKSQPSFWILHGRSGIELLLGYTPYTNALWTEKAREDVEYLLKHPYSRINTIERRRKRRYKRRTKLKNRENFVQEHPGQKIILDYIFD